MCVKEWKRIAEREAMHYREYKAYEKGVEDAADRVPERYAERLRWTLAVEYVLAYWDRHDAEKARFFRAWYGIDEPRRTKSKNSMIALSFELHAAASTLYDWRKEAQTLLVIAATQTGALRPYRMGV